ncbi:MAG: aminotransferase class I/II-fold pyridoxal phosphate-dependent enzyme [Myxococcota bacterium]
MAADDETPGRGGAIAIVGMGARFAGARDLQAYWRMTLEGRDGFGPVPAHRWDFDAFHDPNPRAADKSYAPRGGFIEDVRSFPAVDLQIPPRRVEVMDPQQRMALEIAIQAVEDSGRVAAELPRRTGVYMGVTAMEFKTLLSSRISAQLMATGAFGEVPEDPDSVADAVSRVVTPRPFSAPGVLSNMIAATVAQELRLRGPAYTTDAACSSALVALADAVNALRAGAVDAALAGGVYVCLTPEHHVAFSRIGAMSKKGDCLPFDARADGFVQGDGCGVVVLKRLEDAQRDGDRIYAVLRGMATNNDGGGPGPMAPVLEGQREVVEMAWEDAGLDPARLGYVETHGTGTSVGDATELKGLVESVGARTERAALGSSKANVGHTMSAAGVAGLIRAALAIHHRTLPPMAGFESPKPDLGLEDTPFHVPTTPQAWDTDDRVACVSSFGFGGTNGHAVLEGVETAPALHEQAELVLMCAPDVDALRDLAARTADAVEADPAATAAGVARAWARRRRQPARLGVVAATRRELIDRLRAVGRGEHPEGVSLGTAEEPAKVAFLYPGQGAQRTGMIAGIRDRFPVVAQTLEELDGAVEGVMERPITHCLYPERRPEPVDAETAEAELTATENCQPALLAVGVALTRLLEQVGVKPHVVAGHSVGEFTAAVAGGVLSPAEGARWTAERGAGMAAMTGDRGAMVALVADRDTVEDLLVDGAVVANVNHPKQMVVSGTTEAVEAVARRAEERDVKAVRLNVSHGFHSPVFERLDLSEVIDGLDLSDPEVPVASCIVDHAYRDADEAREVFRAHATSPVLFTDTVATCQDLGADLYLQVGAGGPLRSFARGSLGRGHEGILSLASKEDRDGGASLLKSLADLWTRGVDVDVSMVTAGAPVASVPPTVFSRRDYWPVKDRGRRMKLAGPSAHLEAREEAREEAPKEAAVEAEAPASGSSGGVADVVLDAVARTSAYPREALRAEMTLGDDLGFDSMMVADLAEELSRSIPGLPGIPQELLINRPTIADLIAFADDPEAEPSEAVDDDAPLSRFAPSWRPVPLPSTGRRAVPEGARALVAGPGAEAAKAVAEALEGAGVAVRTDSTGEAADAEATDLLVWVASPEAPTPVTAVLAGEAPAPDPAGDLVAALDAQAKAGARPDVLLLRRDDDPWAEALSAAVRSVGREWTDALARSVRLADPTGPEAAEAALEEWLAIDRSADVARAGGERFVAGTERLAGEVEPFAPGEDDVVLVTGGTRGIGAKLAARLAEGGATVLLMGRGEPSEEAAGLMARHEGRVVHVKADVTDRASVEEALADRPAPTVLVHAAGVLADGPLGQVDPERGRLARRVKVEGWLNAAAACGRSLRVALGVGSWAGRFGSRHQAHYAAANALMSELSRHMPERVRAAVAEFGPWADSSMVASIPESVRRAMRTDGVDFVGDEAGLTALLEDLGAGEGPVIRGRKVPAVLQKAERTVRLDTETHPYLLDHAIEGTPVLPLAAAATMLADTAALRAPFAVHGLTLFQGVTVREPIDASVVVDGDRAELRTGDRGTLCYRADLVRSAEPVEAPAPREGGEEPTLSLREFYDDVTFHGPLLQGVEAIEAVGRGFVRGRVRTSRPADWIPGADQDAWAIDPLAFDSAMQLTAYVAWTRFGRAGTPVGFDRWVQLQPFPAGATLTAEALFAEGEDDRFSADITFRDADGRPLAVAQDVVAQLRRVEGDEDEADPLEGFEMKPEWTDVAEWPEYKDLRMRFQGLEAMGLQNPYFDLHQATARDTTRIGDRDVVNFSSYNYLGLSGDERIRRDVSEAMERYGTSVSASRIASGERPFHRDLEALIARCLDVDDAVVFPSGHATNVTVIGHMFGPNDLILHDELIHDSCLQGIKLAGSARRGFRHDDPDHLEEQVRELRRHYEKVLILIEGVYSMDGDVANLPRYLEIKRRYGCMLMIDEAHSFGTIGATGCGIREHFGIAGSEVDIWMGTLSKSAAAMGGFIGGSKALVEFLKYTTPGFVFAAGMTPTLGQSALSALRLMLEEPWRVERLQRNAKLFRDAMAERGVDTGLAKGESPVIPAITGDSMQALLLADRLLAQGINAKPIIFPAVANDAARLRFFLTTLHTEEQLRWTADCVADTLAEIRREMKQRTS